MGLILGIHKVLSMANPEAEGSIEKDPSEAMESQLAALSKANG